VAAASDPLQPCDADDEDKDEEEKPPLPRCCQHGLYFTWRRQFHIVSGPKAASCPPAKSTWTWSSTTPSAGCRR